MGCKGGCCVSAKEAVKRCTEEPPPNKNGRTFRSGRPKLLNVGVASSARLGHRGVRRLLLGDRALEVDRLLRQLTLFGLEQEGVEAAAVIDGLQRVGRDPQPDRAAE